MSVPLPAVAAASLPEIVDERSSLPTGNFLLTAGRALPPAQTLLTTCRKGLERPESTEHFQDAS
jgi:hypothetical protein